MKAFLIIYPNAGAHADQLRAGMQHFKIAEHISDNSSIVMSFYDEEDIIRELDAYNPMKTAIFVMRIPGAIYTSHVTNKYLEPANSDHL
ncbi:MAG: hypothetical protein R2794_13275 [Chitinophagales bacterium]